jgi:hypothetical protein
MRNLLPLLSLLSFTLAAQAQEPAGACKPTYELVHEACKPSGDVTGWYTKRIEHVTVNSGACEVPDARALCDQHDKTAILSSTPGGRDVRTVEGHTERADGKYCGSITNLRAKVDVVCTFELEAPRYKMVADETCPVRGATETSNCYEKDETDLDTATIDGCLKAKPASDREWWLKAVCLLDAYKVAKTGVSKGGINASLYKRVEDQLTIIGSVTARRPSLQKLNAEIQAELQ